MLHQAGLFGTAKQVVKSDSETEISGLLEHEVFPCMACFCIPLILACVKSSDDPEPQSLTDPFDGSAMEMDPPPSSLFGKSKSVAPAVLKGVPRQIMEEISDGSKEMEIERSAASEEDDADDDDDDDDDEYVPFAPTYVNKATIGRSPPKSPPPKPSATNERTRRSTRSLGFGLEKDLHGLSIYDVNLAAEDSTIIVPNRRSREGTGEGEGEAVKKKKRYVLASMSCLGYTSLSTSLDSWERTS